MEASAHLIVHTVTYLRETNVSATARTSPGSESIPALREDSGRLSIWNQLAVGVVRDLITAPASRTVDASRRIFKVRRNQTYNNSALGTVGGTKVINLLNYGCD